MLACAEISKMDACSIQQIKLGSDIIVDGLFFNETNIKLNSSNNQVILSDSYSDQKYIPTDIHNELEKDNYDVYNDNSMRLKRKCKKIQQMSSDNLNLDNHLEIQLPIKQSYTCTVCQKLFHYKYRYDAHMQSHNVDKQKYKCTICDKSFTRKYHISIHNRIHTGEKPYKCDLCKKLFSMKHHLLSHIRTHTGEKPYTCDMCNESFTRKDILSKHVRTHIGEQLFTCVKCHKQFSMKTYTGEKQYFCHLCQGQQIEPQSNIVNNINTKLNHDFGLEMYDNNKCIETTDIVDIKYENNIESIDNESRILMSALNMLPYQPYNEMLNNTKEFQSDVKCLETFCSVEFKEKPYKCHMCQQLFSNKQNLDSHIRSHTTKQPYTCTICKKSFFYKYRFDAHITNHKMDKRDNLTIHMATHNISTEVDQ
ncbi:hypothetical protein ACI65C_003320 [Semiaphis heraclei]